MKDPKELLKEFNNLNEDMHKLHLTKHEIDQLIKVKQKRLWEVESGIDELVMAGKLKRNILVGSDL